MKQAAGHVAAIEAARECFVHAIGNIDILLDMLVCTPSSGRSDC
ncbi:hypothetical protein ACIBO2_51665 [Nonomuraea sp. NPDC050022]